MPTTEKDVQNLLLRLLILLATSLQTIREPPPSSQQLESSSQPLPSPSHYADVAHRIHADLVALFLSAQKTATSLSLALKPSKAELEKRRAPQASRSSQNISEISPTQSLDAASLDAAQAQLNALANDVLPKLVFLARKATSEAQVWMESDPEPSSHAQHVPSDEADEELHQLQMRVAAMGGQLVRGAPSSQIRRKRVAGAGLGRQWARRVSLEVQLLIDAVSDLARAFMTQRSRDAVDHAAAARARAAGKKVHLPTSTQPPPRNLEEARERALQATARVWSACDGVEARLPLDQTDAVRRAWRQRGEVMEDGWKELREAAGMVDQDGQGGDDGGGEARSVGDHAHVDNDAVPPDASDPFAGIDEALALDDAERALARRFVPLIQMGRMMHARVGQTYLSKAKKTDAAAAAPTVATPAQQGVTGSPAAALDQPPPVLVDLDDLNDADEALQEAQDDLVAAVMYGGEEDFELDLGRDDDESEEDEEDGEDGNEASSAGEMHHQGQEGQEAREGGHEASAPGTGDVDDDARRRRHLDQVRRACQAYADAATALAGAAGVTLATAPESTPRRTVASPETERPRPEQQATRDGVTVAKVDDEAAATTTTTTSAADLGRADAAPSAEVGAERRRPSGGSGGGAPSLVGVRVCLEEIRRLSGTLQRTARLGDAADGAVA